MLSPREIRAGSLLQLDHRSYPSAITAFKIILEKNKTSTFYVRLKGSLSIYTPNVIDFKISTLEEFEQQDKKRFFTSILLYWHYRHHGFVQFCYLPFRP